MYGWCSGNTREELDDDWADQEEFSNDLPFSSMKTSSHIVPDHRSPDHDLWTAKPPPCALL